MCQYDALLKRHLMNLERGDYRSALICAVLANIYRDPKKGKVFEPKDFMPGKTKPKKPQTEDQMLAVARMWNAALGGEVI